MLTSLSSADLPPPEPDALAISEALTTRLRKEIVSAGGWIGFDRFMELALYAPGLGYYSAGAAKIGAAGDFTTAAELGFALPDALASLFQQLLADMVAPTVLELGAGTGRLAARLITQLKDLGLTDFRYQILETSADLRARQLETLAPLVDQVDWLEELPESPIDGVIFGNEVADALPVARFVRHNGHNLPIGVAIDGDAVVVRPGPANDEIAAAVGRIEAALGFAWPEGYRSEICLLLKPWIKSLAAKLGRGALLLIDYGLSRRDYYRLDRRDGTLVCHYRHRAHGDPLFLPGLQDISAWVDFSASAEAGREAGLVLAGFTTQAQFLIETLAAGSMQAPVSAESLSAFKTLILPGEMGENFKLQLLARDLPNASLPGRDFRAWL